MFIAIEVFLRHHLGKGLKEGHGKFFLADKRYHLVVKRISTLYRSGLCPCIKMDADSDYHRPKGKVIFSTNFQVLQLVVVQKALVQPLACGAFVVNFFVFIRIARYPCLKAEVSLIFDVDGASICSGRAFFFMLARLYPAAFQRAPVFVGIFQRVVSPWAHFAAAFADGMPLLVKQDVIRSIFRRSGSAIYVNKGIDVPMVRQPVSGDVVMCGIKANVFGRKPP